MIKQKAQKKRDFQSELKRKLNENSEGDNDENSFSEKFDELDDIIEKSFKSLSSNQENNF